MLDQGYLHFLKGQLHSKLLLDSVAGQRLVTSGGRGLVASGASAFVQPLGTSDQF